MSKNRNPGAVDLWDPNGIVPSRLKFESNESQRRICDELKLMVNPDAITYPEELHGIGEAWDNGRRA